MINSKTSKLILLCIFIYGLSGLIPVFGECTPILIEKPGDKSSLYKEEYRKRSYQLNSEETYSGKYSCIYKKTSELQLSGQYFEGLKFGPWSGYHVNGEKSFEGSYKNGDPDGVHKTWNSDTKISTIKEYKDGIKHGKWAYYSSGQKKSEGIYKNGVKHGKWYEDRNIGEYSDGIKHGEWYESSSKLKGKYVNGKKEGKWNSDNNFHTVEYKNGLKHGKEVRISPGSGSKMEAIYNKGELVSETHSDGLYGKRREFKNGIRTIWSPGDINPKTICGANRKWKKHGKCTWYYNYKKGQKRKECEFRNGKVFRKSQCKEWKKSAYKSTTKDYSIVEQTKQNSSSGTSDTLISQPRPTVTDQTEEVQNKNGPMTESCIFLDGVWQCGDTQSEKPKPNENILNIDPGTIKKEVINNLFKSFGF